MLIATKHKLEKCVSTDGLRPALQQVNIVIEGKTGKAIATNGIALAVVPIQPEDGDESGLLSIEGLQRARKMAFDDAGKPLDNGQVLLNEHEQFKDGALLPRIKPETLFPETESLITPATANATHYHIGLNIKALKNICDALGSDSVKLSFPKDNSKAIVIRPTDYESEAYGILMPIRLI